MRFLISKNCLQAEKAERDKVKQLTLEINERQEEEEALEMMQQVKLFQFLVSVLSFSV